MDTNGFDSFNTKVKIDKTYKVSPLRHRHEIDSDNRVSFSLIGQSRKRSAANTHFISDWWILMCTLDRFFLILYFVIVISIVGYLFSKIKI